MSDLQELASATFMLRFTKVVDIVSPMLSKKQLTMLDHVNYNPMASRLVNLMAEGIQQNHNLLEIVAEFNAEVEQNMSIDDLFGNSLEEEKQEGPTEEPP